MKISVDMVFVAAIALTSVAIPVLGTAGEPTAVVQYRAAELASPQGVAGLHARLAGAARLVCAPYSSIELARQRVFARCAKESLAAAVARVHNPALTAYHEGKTGEHIGATELALKLAGQPTPTGVHYR